MRTCRFPRSPYSLPIHHSLVRRGSHGSRSGAVCQGLIGSGRMLPYPNEAFLQMRISLPGCGLLFAGLLFYFLLVAGGCSAHAAHESPVSSIASLTSMLKAKIPATLDQAAKDYNVARSMFQRAAMHRSKGTELFSKGYEMRRAALLKAKALVRSLSLAGLGAYSRAAVRDLNIITSLAHRIALIATNPQPARNSQSLLSHFSDAAARARDRLHSYNHALDDSMLPHPESHFTQELFHAEMLCARGKIFQALADSEDSTGTQLKQKAKSLVLQVKGVQSHLQSLSGKASVENHSPVAKKIISLEKHEAARDSSVTNYLLHKDKSTVVKASSGIGISTNLVHSVTSDLRNEDMQEARDERRHLDVDVDYGKVPRSHHTLADSLVQFSHRLEESDLKPADSQISSPVEARAPIPLGTDYDNRAALEVAQETSPDDQVDLSAGHFSGDDLY